MQHDSFGSPTSTTDAEALQGINDFGEGLLAYQTRSARIIEVADRHPDSALANICAGLLLMFLETPEAPEKSMPYGQRAAAIKDMNAREQALLSLLQAWQVYDHRRVRSIADELIKHYPMDLSTLKIAQYHAFNAGDARHMRAMASDAVTHNANCAPVYSMLAFAHEQCNELDAAERAAEKALSLNPQEPWAHHALAHVHLGRGTTRAGLAFLTEHAASWQDLNSFMFTHNWWHVALFELAHGELSQALNIYDQYCWGVQPEYSQDQIGAVSLLVRLELAGVDVSDRWAQLASYLQARTQDVIQPFLTLQYLYGLARAVPDQAPLLMELIELQAHQSTVPQDRQLWLEVGIPAARAMMAHAASDFESAAIGLAEIRNQLWRIGGSHAQRDLFEQILLDARLRAGHWSAARKTLEFRLRFEPESPILRQRLNDLYSQLNA